MNPVKSVYIIYNPISTGPAKQHALELQQSLTRETAVDCILLKTNYEKHAITLARQYAKPGVMIVASSGDGGFHELINGVLTSNAPQQTVVGLLPSGNANDHYAARHAGDTVKRIVHNDVAKMDVLKIAWNDEVHYAHSYAGLGITADIGKELTEQRPNMFVEVWLVLTGLIRRHPVRVIISGHKRRYDSIVFNLIGQMSKYLSTGEKHRAADGTFDVMLKRHTSLAALFRHLLRRVVKDEIKDATSFSTLTFTTIHKTSIQLDGEVYALPANTEVRVTCIRDALHCII